MMCPNRRKPCFLAVFFLVLALLSGYILYQLIWNGVILLNNPSPRRYPVRGVDVSSYQGNIDWPVLAAQNIQFAFIKATEGATYVDEYFSYNLAQAQAAGLRVGAYHFFSCASGGQEQADNFISEVRAHPGMLPPVVDFEVTEAMSEQADLVRLQLDTLIQALEQHYGVKPILYATESAYRTYLAGLYDPYDIWIRNVKTKPRLSDGRSWTFWQYTNRERLDGYRGKERFIDMNVFYGTADAFQQYGINELEVCPK